MSVDTNEKWIRDFLVPTLVQNGKFGGNVTIKSVEVRPLSLSEAFMMTICHKVKLTVTDSQANDQVYGIVVKTTPEFDGQNYILSDFTTLFENEVMVYKTILPALKWEDSFPQYYYSDIQPRRATIALSDFTFDGYRMSTSLVNLSLEHILLSVIALGKFHGGFYGLKQTNPTIFNSIRNSFNESRYRFELPHEIWDRRLRIGPKRAIKATRNTVGGCPVPEEFLVRLEHLLQDPYNYQKKLVQPVEPLAVVCHGDYLRNNISYKYAADGETPISSKMFDFQTFRYASPMVDLNTFMANSTGVDVRTKHFDEIFSAYHTNLIETYCEAVGIEQTQLPEYLSYECLLKEYVRFLPFGISIAASFMVVLHVPIEDGWKFEDQTEADEIDDAYNRGGDAVDRELRALVNEIYTFNTTLNLEL